MQIAPTTNSGPFVPVVSYQERYRGRRGFETTPTRRLSELLDRYKALKADRAVSPAVRAYARQVVRELRDELAARQPDRQVAA